MHTPLSSDPLPAIGLGDCPRRWANRHGQRTALVDSARRLSYAAFEQRVDRLAAALHRQGIARGDRAILQLPNGIAFVTVCFALFRIGALPVLAMPAHRARDIDALFRVAEPVAYFISEGDGGFDFVALAKDMAAAHPRLKRVIVDGEAGDAPGFVALAALDATPRKFEAPAADEVALLLLSGGTTGTPKVVARTHADYSDNFRACARVCRLDSDAVYLAVLPAAHHFVLGCPGILGTLASGGTVVLSDTASADEAMPLIARERVTHVALVPPLAQLWVAARAWETSDLSSLRLVQIGGSRLTPTLAASVLEAFASPLQQVFGMAEGLLCMTRLDDPRETMLHTQGRPVSAGDDIRIVDADGRDLPPGSVGELLVRGPSTIRAYYRAPEQDARSFTADGYLRTGDLVRRDARGNLVVEGRLEEQIRRGGDKIAAIEIEGPLGELIGPGAAAVVGVPDVLLGERICAFLQVAGRLPSDADLKEALRARGLSDLKLPDQIEAISHWPLTPVGKIDKQRLVEIATQRRAGSTAPIARYTEQRLPVTRSALDLAARLAGLLDNALFSVYECRGEWSIGLDAAASLSVDALGTVRCSHAVDRTGVQPCAAIADALAALPIAGWRAHGRASFEFSHLLHELDEPAGEDAASESLFSLFVPKHEIRLREGQALIRSLSADELPRLVAWVRAADRAVVDHAVGDQAADPTAAHAARWADPRPIAAYEVAEAKATYQCRVASAVADMQSARCQKVTLSRTVDLPPELDMVASYLCGRRANTPARSFLLRDGRFQAYGFSPETLVEVDAQGRVGTRPLAGTRALGGTPAEDARLERELLTDAKEIAAHAVSVKMVLGEMSGVCEADSVAVSEFMSICRRGSVQHLASRVRGRLAPGRHAWDAFACLFPAVTASGIPKREALESIRRHEEQPRGLYSGSVMIVDSDGAMDAALVLRSAYRDGERCWLQAGAGLVPMSSPDREWAETCEKLASVAKHLRAS